MAIEAPKRKIIFIGNEAPSIQQYSAWIDTATRTIRVFEGGNWVTKADFADAMPDGVTATFKVANVKLTFKKGILTSYD